MTASEQGRVETPLPSSPERLAGKVAIVTGSGSRAPGIGNGRATAILLARHGAKVVVVDREVEAAEATKAAIDDDANVAVVVGDVTEEETCQRMVDTAMSQWGRLDVLVNNVGIDEGPGSVVDVALERWEHVLHVNVGSMIVAASKAVPVMEAAHSGVIINISSISAFRPRGLTPYTTSKGAVIALSRAMAVDHGPKGVRVNCIAPGPVYTPMVFSGGMTEERRAARRDASLLKVEGTAWDVGYAALYLASDEARYITGVVLPVDGGVSVTSAAR